MSASLRTIIRAAIAASFVFVATAAYAQQPANPDEASSSCTHTFSKGAGAAQVSYCVNSHGTMPSFVNAGLEHLLTGTFYEGYLLCSSLGSHGYDVGFTESAWGAVTGPINLTATGVTYTRTTADGRFRIEHTFKLDALEHDVTITVKVINLTASPIAGVIYRRVADIDAANSAGSDVFTRSLDEVEGVDTVSLRGMSLNAITFATSHSTAIETFTAGVPACAFPASLANGHAGDDQATVQYNLGTINALKFKTVKFVYKRK